MAARLNGIRAHFESHGEGDPVLLINGLSAPWANWLSDITMEQWEDVNRAVPTFPRGVTR